MLKYVLCSRARETSKAVEKSITCESTDLQKKIDGGIIKNLCGWDDGTGHIVQLIEWGEDTNALAKLYADEECSAHT
jgi:hypothetical protein